MSLLNHIQKAIAVIAIAFLFGCKPNHSADELSQLNQQLDSLSVEVAENVYITYTDSAILRATIKAPILKRFPDKKILVWRCLMAFQPCSMILWVIPQVP